MVESVYCVRIHLDICIHIRILMCIGRLKSSRDGHRVFSVAFISERATSVVCFKSENSRSTTAAVQNFTRSEPDFWGRRDRCGRTVTTATTRFN